LTRHRNERSERLEVRVTFTRTRLRGVSARAYQRILREIFSRWLDGDLLPDGFEMRIAWRNPDNRNPRHADWKSVDIDSANNDDEEVDAARVTLNKGGWLSAAAHRLPFKRSREEREEIEITFDDLERQWRSGAITRRAKREGKNPRRVYAGLKGARTRKIKARLEDE
jgi:hypothetical protein